MSAEAKISHGRGGLGNISPDDTPYVDGEIHREGDPTTAGSPYSAGRGGAGNIGSPKVAATKTGNDDDIIPDAALVKADDTYHAGRGGEGNAVVGGENVEAKKKHDGLADKLKRKILWRH